MSVGLASGSEPGDCFRESGFPCWPSLGPLGSPKGNDVCRVADLIGDDVSYPALWQTLPPESASTSGRGPPASLPSPMRVCELRKQASIPPAARPSVAGEGTSCGPSSLLDLSVGHIQLYLRLKPQRRRRKRSGGSLLDRDSLMQELACPVARDSDCLPTISSLRLGVQHTRRARGGRQGLMGRDLPA